MASTSRRRWVALSARRTEWCPWSVRCCGWTVPPTAGHLKIENWKKKHYFLVDLNWADHFLDTHSVEKEEKIQSCYLVSIQLLLRVSESNLANTPLSWSTRELESICPTYLQGFPNLSWVLLFVCISTWQGRAIVQVDIGRANNMWRTDWGLRLSLCHWTPVPFIHSNGSESLHGRIRHEIGRNSVEDRQVKKVRCKWNRCLNNRSTSNRPIKRAPLTRRSVATRVVEREATQWPAISNSSPRARHYAPRGADTAICWLVSVNQQAPSVTSFNINVSHSYR